VWSASARTAHGVRTRLQTILDPAEQRQLAQPHQVVDVQAERHLLAGRAAVKRQLLPSETSINPSSDDWRTYAHTLSNDPTSGPAAWPLTLAQLCTLVFDHRAAHPLASP